MPTFRGLVDAVEVRFDGWVELTLLAAHAGNVRKTLLIEDLDGDLDKAHRRLAQLSLARDALARVLPVEVQFESEAERGDLIQDIRVVTRPSIEGRPATRRVEGIVIGITLTEFGPFVSGGSYRDAPDLAAITLLADDTTVEVAMLDLQRPDPLTAQAMLTLLQRAHRNRRKVAVLLSTAFQEGTTQSPAVVADGTNGSAQPGYIQSCEWLVVVEQTLDYVYAFIERLTQRYESYEAGGAKEIAFVKATYTTAPGQTPEGDVSDNGTFTPATLVAWVHGDAPLLDRLETALRDRLQVRLGLLGEVIHEIELVAHLGSAARPIWVEVRLRLHPHGGADLGCQNTPTIQGPTQTNFDALPVTSSWHGKGYFNEGIWRFVMNSPASHKLLIDGKPCCCLEEGSGERGREKGYDLNSEAEQCHAYLDGMHCIEIVLSARSCAEAFQLLAYRIR